MEERRLLTGQSCDPHWQNRRNHQSRVVFTTENKSCFPYEYGWSSWIMISTNVILLLVGVSLIVIGVWSVANQNFYSQFFEGKAYSIFSWGVLLTGMFLTVISIIGVLTTLKIMNNLLKVDPETGTRITSVYRHLLLKKFSILFLNCAGVLLM